MCKIVGLLVLASIHWGMKENRQIYNSAETNGYEFTLVSLNWRSKFCKNPFGLHSRSQLYCIQCRNSKTPCSLTQIDIGSCSAVTCGYSAHKLGCMRDSSSLNTFKQYEDLTEVKVVVLNVKQSYPGLTKVLRLVVMIMQMRLLGDRWTGQLKSSKVLLKVYIWYLWHCTREYCMNFRTVQRYH